MEDSEECIIPNSVSLLVAITIPDALPWVTSVPMNTVFRRSVTGILWPGRSAMTSMFLTTGSFSPVNEDSSTSKSTDYAR